MLRFSPPHVSIPPEVRWMLLRAFGPPGAPSSGSVAAAAALAMARRFEVAPRIAVRQGRARLAAELGEGAAGFQRDLTASAAQGLRLEAVLLDVLERAVAREIPLVPLKLAALEAAGRVAPGARSACDLDLLAPPERAEELQQDLLDHGFRTSGLPPSEHQLPALIHPAGGVVEVHRLIPGVRPGTAGSATVASLEAAGLLAPAPGLPGCRLPVQEVLIAHALVHGIGQHGFWPDSYSLLRTLGDLIDLGFHQEEEAPRAERAVALVARDVSTEEAEATRSLCRALAEGIDLVESPSPAGILLRHILAGRLDPDYAAALRLNLFRSQPSDRAPLVRMVRTAFGALFLSRAQIDAIYGKPRHPLGYLGRRLARPFDLLRRLWSYSRRALQRKG